MRRSPNRQPDHASWMTSLMKQLLDEVRVSPMDIAARTRVDEIYVRSVGQLEQAMAMQVVDELEPITLPFCCQEHSSSEPSGTQDRRVSRVSRLLGDIETAQLGRQRQQERLQEAKADNSTVTSAAALAYPLRRGTARGADRHRFNDPSNYLG